jgi:hypothetical protein
MVTLSYQPALAAGETGRGREAARAQTNFLAVRTSAWREAKRAERAPGV